MPLGGCGRVGGVAAVSLSPLRDLRQWLGALYVVGLGAAPALGQAPARVDFARDVQPIFKSHCVSCHGPTQQLNGFRLDRRAAAFRGGTFPVIAPGSSAGSRLYLKLLGQQFGQQMPPAGKLSDAEIETIKNWLDQGADWPEALAGEPPSAPVVPAAARVMDALRRGDSVALGRALTSGGSRAARAVGARGGWTPLMFAALYGNADAVRRLLALGANANAVTDSGTSALMLAAHDADATRLLLQAGANPNQRPEDGRTPLIVASARVGASAVVKLLLDAGADPKALSAARTSALRLAAGVGEAESMRLLIAGGADLKADAAAALTASLNSQCRACADLVIGAVDARAFGGSLLTMARGGDAAAVRFLLERGADVNARDGAGRTPLMMAAYTDAYPVNVVRLLLDWRADVSLRSTEGDTAASIASIRGGPLAGLVGSTGATAVPPDRPPPAPAPTPREAVLRSLPLLQRTDAVFLEKSGCVSCHHNSLTAHTVAQARANGLRVEEGAAASHKARMAPFVAGWRESALRGFGIPGQQDTVGYVLYGLIGARVPADASTDALAYYLKGLQMDDGHWRLAANRPPIESSEIQVTAVAMRALQEYAPPARRAEYEAAVAAAGRWLATARASSTEDRAFQLLGIAWAGGDRPLVASLARELVAEQRPDGGWAPIARSGMAADAYATGQALTALHQSGALQVTDEAYGRGVRYLLSTQLADGSWFVKSRALPIQAHFESEFPHGADQFISAAATNWAAQALIPAVRASTRR